MEKYFKVLLLEMNHIMNKKLLSSFVAAFILASTCFAQENLFNWNNGSVIPNTSYIKYNEPKQSRNSQSPIIAATDKILHTYTLSSKNGQYDCSIQLVCDRNVTEENKYYREFVITANNGSLIYRRSGWAGLTTTKWWSQNFSDNNYYRRIDLNNDSYALLFAGNQSDWEELFGEMIIVIISKNVATLVYDGPAKVISSTDFNQTPFSMDFITDATNLIDTETGLFDITPNKLAGRTKYRLYKDGDVLKIASWVNGNGPSLN